MPKANKSLTRRARLKDWWLRHRLLTKLAVIGVTVFVVMVTTAVAMAWYYRYTQRNKLVEYGTSFSLKYAQELGLDWQANFTALLDDLQFKHFRLMSYWDLHEPEKDQYDFTDLDWQMDEAAKRGAKVLLAIGLRQPRWPECHMAPWAARLERSERNRELYDYIAIVVQRYSTHPALKSYQLENEYYNTMFGECDDHSRDRLIKEMEIVKNLDSKHPLVISFANQLGMPFRGPHPDVYATSLYRGNYVKYIGYFAYPISSHFYGAKALLVRWLYGTETVLHELQLEPWGPRPTSVLSDAEQARYMGLDKIRSNMTFARRTGMKEIYLWGGEWWYWRMTERHDPVVWETIREGLKEVGPVSSIVN